MTAARYTDSRPSLQRLSDALTLAVMAALTVASAAVMASMPQPAEPLRLPMVVVTAKSSAQTAAQTATQTAAQTAATPRLPLVVVQARRSGEV